MSRKFYCLLSEKDKKVRHVATKRGGVTLYSKHTRKAAGLLVVSTSPGILNTFSQIKASLDYALETNLEEKILIPGRKKRNQ